MSWTDFLDPDHNGIDRVRDTLAALGGESGCQGCVLESKAGRITRLFTYAATTSERKEKVRK